MNQDITKIDPALGLMGEFSKVTQGTVAHINRMRQDAIFTDGMVQAKYKALAATMWSISARCEPCIKFYVQKATALGASEHEVGEFLAVASTMGGCVGEMWALKAYKAFKDSQSGDSANMEEPSCCSP